MLLKFLVFEFWQFNCNVFGVALFKFKLFGILWASWIWIYISLPGFKKLSATIALNILCMPFFFPSPFSIPIMQIMFLFSVFYNCYRRFLLFHSFFSLLLWLVTCRCPVFKSTDPFLHLFHYAAEPLYWFFFHSAAWISAWYFLCFYHFWNFHFGYDLLSCAAFYDHILNSPLEKSLISISLILFSGDSLTGTYSPVSSLSLTLYVGFCAWHKTVTSPSLDRLISCRRQTFSISLA